MSTQLAIVFPGQGSQHLGMLSGLSEAFPIIRQTFNEASEVLGYDAWDLAQNGPEEKLNQTDFTQPLMLTAGLAVYRVLKAHEVNATCFAGHSLGEYTALVAADVIAFSDGVSLVAKRGALMTETVPMGQGAMAAIVGLSDEAVSTLCQEASEKTTVTPANFNAPGQVVVAGHTEAVLRAVDLAQAQGAKLARQIPVSAPCHCDLLKPAADALSAVIQDTSFSAPTKPVLSNVTGQQHQGVERIREDLVKQLYQPVQWVACMQALPAMGVMDVIESGPGKVLTGLLRRINREIKAHTVNDRASLEKTLSALADN